MSATVTWNGAEQLRGNLRPIEDLTLHPENSWRGDVAEIAKSLERWGQVRPLLVDEGGVVVAGNHTLLAARSLEWSHVAAVTNTFASPEEAYAYLLADNRLAELGEYDRAELVLLVADLEASGKWDGTGYQADDLAHLRALEAAANAPPANPILEEPSAAPVAPPALREVVLLFDETQQAAFGVHVRALRVRYGLEGVTDTVLRALRDEAFRVNQGIKE